MKPTQNQADFVLALQTLCARHNVINGKAEFEFPSGNKLTVELSTTTKPGPNTLAGEKTITVSCDADIIFVDRVAMPVQRVGLAAEEIKRLR